LPIAGERSYIDPIGSRFGTVISVGSCIKVIDKFRKAKSVVAQGWAAFLSMLFENYNSLLIVKRRNLFILIFAFTLFGKAASAPFASTCSGSFA
jgi:hypothetical protein